MSDSRSVFVLNAGARMCDDTLLRWLDGHPRIRRIRVYSPQHVDRLAQLLAPRQVDALGNENIPSTAQGPSRSLLRLAGSIGRYDTIIVLCVDDDQVTTGRAPFRIIGEILFSRSLVLIGPHTATHWPGGWGLLRPQRARELATLAALGAFSVLTTTITLTVVMADELLHRVRMGR